MPPRIDLPNGAAIALLLSIGVSSFLLTIFDTSNPIQVQIIPNPIPPKNIGQIMSVSFLAFNRLLLSSDRLPLKLNLF